MLPTERIPYSPIAGRPPLQLPGGARMAVWVIVNVEEWDAEAPMPRTVLTPPAGGSPSPDIPNWAWHEYGNRVGFWRILDALDTFSIKAVLAINDPATIFTVESVPEETVYNITKAIFDNLEELGTVHPQAGAIALATATNTPIQLHPGAQRYFDEAGQ